jgi:hypothetical protein
MIQDCDDDPDQSPTAEFLTSGFPCAKCSSRFSTKFDRLTNKQLCNQCWSEITPAVRPNSDRHLRRPPVDLFEPPPYEDDQE